MEATMRAIFIALQIAPMLALMLTLPRTVVGYAREKTLDVRRATYEYVFVIYFICAYFMTMLPLPSPEYFDALTPMSENIQLVPFNCFFETNLLRSPVALAIVVFNVILTVPLGFFLRFLFKADLKRTVLAGFLTATLYEVTQLTGLFFIYPGPYRIFDVDDFILNTLGALIGYFTVPLLSRVLPRLNDEKKQLTEGSEVSFFQRLVAMLIDIVLIFLITTATLVCVPPVKSFFLEGSSLLRFPAFYIGFVFIAAVYSSILRGGTLGHKLTGLRLLRKGGEVASRALCAARTVAVCSMVVAIPFWVYFFMTVNTEYAGLRSILWVLLGAVLMMCAAAILLEMMFNAVTHGSSMFYDRLLGSYIAYGSSRKTSLFGIRVIDIRGLSEESVDRLSDTICETLASMGVADEAVLKVRLMAEGVLLDWIENGLSGSPCELRLDKRFGRSILMLSVSGEDKTNEAVAEGYADMLSGLELTLDTYYAGEKNICNIHVPPEKETAPK